MVAIDRHRPGRLEVSSLPVDRQRGSANIQRTNMVVVDWVPPLPIISEFFYMIEFAASSLDDAVEDVSKFLACWLVFSTVRAALRRVGIGDTSSLVAASAALVAAYPHADVWADKLGDRAQVVLEYCDKQRSSPQHAKRRISNAFVLRRAHTKM